MACRLNRALFHAGIVRNGLQISEIKPCIWASKVQCVAHKYFETCVVQWLMVVLPCASLTHVLNRTIEVRHGRKLEGIICNRCIVVWV